MTNKRALKICNKVILNMFDSTNNYERKIPKNDFLEMLKKSSNALFKEIPFKPLPCKITLGRCACVVGLMDKSTNYCGNCGQKIDWSDNNDN